MHKPNLLDRLVKLFDRWFEHREKKYKGYENEAQEGNDATTKAIMDINKSFGLSDEVNNPCRFL